MAVVISGTSGFTTPAIDSESMPSVDGAPVVESGSNSDGHWVKYADGTQHCRRRWAFPLAQGVFDTSYNEWTYPLPFWAAVDVVFNVSAGSNRGSSAPMEGIFAYAPSITGGAFRIFQREGTGGAAVATDLIIGLSASGRWKA